MSLPVLNLISVLHFALLHGEVESVPLIIASRLIEELKRVGRTHRLAPTKQRLTLLSLHAELFTALEILVVQRPAVLQAETTESLLV